MRAAIITILKNGIPTALLLGALGFVLAEYAGAMIANHEMPRRDVWIVEGSQASAQAGGEVRGILRVRLPICLGLIGFGFVAAFEGLRMIWAKPVEITPVLPEQLTVDELLNQLAARVEAEQRDAKSAPPLLLPTAVTSPE